MATARAPHGNNQPTKIIVKKVYVEGHGGHHGGAWKVAYADFVTAMMAFFLLMWLLGATNEKQRKSIADYFSPTLVQMRQQTAGSNGMFGGSSLTEKDAYPNRASQTGMRSMTIPSDSTGGKDSGSGPSGTLRTKHMDAEDKKNFERLQRQLSAAIAANPNLQRLASHVRFIPTREGLRIDLVDNADYSMFALGTTVLEPEADRLIGMIGQSVRDMANPIMIRGHTDNVAYNNGTGMNNWLLSSGRSEATRRRLAVGGVAENRFDRIEGVADREPMISDNPADARNRRVSITLLYRHSAFNQ